MEILKSFQGKCAIWDWNGTLLDDVSLVVDIMNSLLRQYGLPGLNASRYRDLFEFPVVKYYQKLGFMPDHPAFEHLATAFMHEYDCRVTECALHKGAAELLEGLQGRGIKNVILTAGKRESVTKLLKDYNLSDLFSEVIGHSDHFAGSKELLGLNWLQKRRMDEQASIFIGDTVHDFEVATAMQIRCVLVSHGHNSEHRLWHCGCPVVSSLYDLETLKCATKEF